MPRILYEKWKPEAVTMAHVEQANDICQDYATQGYDLTLRQIYYQFVARGWIENTERSYKRLGDIISKARMAGLLDWDYVVDRTRSSRGTSHFNDPADVMEAARASYRLDKWSLQPTRVEVWVEKEALAGVVSQAAAENDVTYFSCRGYVSQSEQWRAARRLRYYIEAGQNVVVLHLGDHDPSGIDMTRDISERIELFMLTDYYREAMSGIGRASFREIREHMRETCGGREPFQVDRIALNWDQVQQYNPPPNPTKLSDSRAQKYVELYGDESWELDALDPATLDALITERILAVRDDELYEARKHEEQTGRELLREASNRWEDVVSFLENKEA